MNRRDILIGIVILAVLAGAVYFVRRSRKPVLEEIPLTTEEKIEESFRITIPEDVDKIELRDVSGGDALAIATRKYQGGIFSHTVLADLPDPVSGFYQGWLVKGQEIISTGRMTLAKGGWLLEFESKTNYSDYDQVVVTLEEVADNLPEKHILEGGF